MPQIHRFNIDTIVLNKLKLYASQKGLNLLTI